MRIAVVGSGVSGLVCAHLLQGPHDVVLYEADDRPGGHSHTHRIDLPDALVEVDSGFIVYNETTYPLFCKLLDRLGVASQPSDMSFSVTDPSEHLEWRGTSLSTVFAQRRNLARPAFMRMLVDIGRFNRLMAKVLEGPTPESLTLAEVLESRSWTPGFRDWYLTPLGSSIWSADPSSFMQIPAVTFGRFFQRHGLLTLTNQTRWRTVTGGSQSYVKKVLSALDGDGQVRLGTRVEKIRRSETSVELVDQGGVESFDHVIVATHSDQALKLLSDPDRLEEDLLGSIKYQPNHTTLHSDFANDAPEPKSMGELELPASRPRYTQGHAHLPPQPTARDPFEDAGARDAESR